MNYGEHLELDAMLRAGPGHEPMTVGEVLARYLRRPAWMAEAECRGVGPDVFFLDRGQPSAPAKALCARCTVSADCLAYAAENDVQGGIWGGIAARKIHSSGKRPAA